MLMQLFHGTAAANTDFILTEGLKPRGDKLGNWYKWFQQPSIPNMVYLTSHEEQADFHAARTSLIHQSDCTILEVNIVEDNLYPDENLFQLTTIVDTTDMKTMQERALNNKHRWNESLEKCSLVAHEGIIPIEQIITKKTYSISDSKYYGFIKHFKTPTVDTFDRSFGAFLRSWDGFLKNKITTFPDGSWKIDMFRIEVKSLQNNEYEVVYRDE